ncbi:mitotic checkpoint serine/threonine-protein kinase BUB1 isoform X2 [Gasterosteus aculeatus]
MDIATYLQRFEDRMSSYTGDDPLDKWDKFVEYLEQSLPADGLGGMALVFDSLVRRFLNVKQYANDLRYVNCCIRCAGFSPDPVALFSHVYSKGVGTTTAALYVAWARQFEHRGMNEQAEAVYKKAVENRAQPADTVLAELRQFQTRSRSQTAASAGGQSVLQNMDSSQQTSSHREPAAPNKDSLDCPQSYRTVTTVSRSETSGMFPPGRASGVVTVSQYNKEALVLEGSELCFEEVQAQKYFQKLQGRKETKKLLQEEEEELLCSVGCGEFTGEPSLHRLSAAESLDDTQNPFGRPGPSYRPSNRRSLGLRSHPEPADAHETDAHETSVEWPLQQPGSVSSEISHHAPHLAGGSIETWMAASRSLHRNGGGLSRDEPELSAAHQDAVQEEKLNVSQGGTANLSHITPNTSLGFVQATPSRVLPSPTVNTREALGVIMDMFQASTLLEDPPGGAAPPRTAGREFDPGHHGDGVPAAPFMVFQDEDSGGAAPPEKSKPIRALLEIPAPTRPSEPPEPPPDESTMWGARYNSLCSLAACPNTTDDFNMLARFVSTPSTHKASFSFCEGEQENVCGDGEDEAFTRRQPKKLSPIMEQSPSSDVAFGPPPPSSSAAHGTIVGEGLTPPPHCASSSISMVQPPPPAVLSFRDQTLCPVDSSSAAGWDVYTSPEQAAPPPQQLGAEPFTVMEDSDKPVSPARARGGDAGNVPMSPEGFVWSPERRAEPDRDSSPRPRLQTQLCADVPMSPAHPQFAIEDELMNSPGAADVPMDTAGGAAAVHLVSDPWDEELMARLMASLTPPLDTHPHCIRWQCKVPNIAPKTSISIGNASLRVDCVLGKGAFATVYQATDPVTSNRTVLKVQKPANPWEFYVTTQLDARLRPDVRHLFSTIRSAHFFLNGSVLQGELHGHGTLLNVVNMYKTLSEKAMPPPLVMYFTVCILHMVEQLHAVHIIHGDIKPDNLLLGERFLDNRCFEPENVDHGLHLIDLGQSIDMELFPEGTAFTARCLTSGFQCTEMLSGKPWSYQTDYFGIAATVYCMLFGSYMQVTTECGVWRTNGVFRRKPHADLWQDFFHALLNVPHGALPLSLGGLRRSLASALQENYGAKLPSLKSRMMVLLLENRKAAKR